MALRFRRSIKIAPGIRINLNKKSTSVRIGPRGLGYTISSTGKRTISAGIPGTGISFSETTSRKKKKVSESSLSQNLASVAQAQEFVETKPSSSSYRVAGWIIGIVITIVVIAMAFSTPGEKTNLSAAATPQLSDPLDAEAKEIKLRTTANLRLRDGPSTDAKVLLTVPANTLLLPTVNENGWSKVSFEGNNGWVSNDYLESVGEPSL